MFNGKFERKLNHQKRIGLYRNPPEINQRDGRHSVVGGRKMLNFASNDYLGLGSSETVGALAAQNFKKYGASSSSSKLVTGNYSVIREAEKHYAEFFGYEDAVFFPSGYQANVALMSTLFDTGDTILFDKHIHASSVKGITLSGASFFGYRHNALSHLEKRLDSTGDSPVAVVTEGLFSMDGDSPDIQSLKELKMKHGFMCIVDEAHSYGSMGAGGRGISGGLADVGVGTFGKSFGLFGAFILLPRLYREYLLNFASPLIYTTSLPEAHAATAMDVLAIVETSDDKRKYLRDLSGYMKSALEKEGFETEGDAHILAIQIGDEDRAVAVASALFDMGIFSFPARFPTVPLGKAILRVSLTSMHREEDVPVFISCLQKCLN